MKTKFIYIVITLLSISVHAQVSKTYKADKNYDTYAYVDAIKTYERIAEKGYKSEDMFQKLGNSYFFNGQYDVAARWYGELFAMNQNQSPEYLYRYAQSLKSVKEYVQADDLMEQFYAKSQSDIRAGLAHTQKDYKAEIKKNSGRYEIEDAGINSELSDYGTAFYGEKVVFTSARDTGSFIKRKHAWTGESFTNLYGAEMGLDGNLKTPERFGKEIKSKVNEATPIFTKDGSTVYFTRNNYLKKMGRDANKTTLLKIYKATLEDEKWTNITALPFNSDNYSTAHPALSPDEKTLYFASNMPGTLGASDLFKVSINSDGTFGMPENLGPTINTEARETFPFITADNELYFSSDGRPGLGGLDIFACLIKEDGTFSDIQNIGEPANSPFDDFGFIIESKSRKGFLTSNRPGGPGDDDIYKFVEKEKLSFVCEQTLSGVVTDMETSLPLENVKVSLFDDKYKLLKEVYTDKEGMYDFGEVECGLKYYVRAEKATYETSETPITIAEETGKTELPIQLSTAVKKVTVGDDLRGAFGIDIIYFDLDKWNIRPDAALELAKILDVMEQNPTMTIDIRSHTDSRQTFKYNERLSDRRAKSTREWLIKNGIDATRLTAKGYGESQLVNKCADGVECSEDEHQRNRRSEFIITNL